MFCSHCGGSNPDGAAFCQYCGSALTASAGTPLPSRASPPPPPPSGWGPSGPPAPPPRRSGLGRTMLVVFVVFLAIIVIFGVVSYFLPAGSSGPAVTVTGVNFYSPDDACGLNGATDPTWYNTTAGQSFALTYEISGNVTGNVSGVNTTAPCEIYTITTTTANFTLSGANVPLVVPANSTVTLGFTVNPPSYAFTGVLTLVLT